MVADALSTPSITNLDATPLVQNTSGQGAPGNMKDISDVVTPTAAGLVDTGSKYKMVRVPTNAKLKRAQLIADATLETGGPTLAVDVGIYYSDSTVDGTAPANQGLVVSGQTAALVSNVAFGAAATLTIDALSNFSATKRNQPLWQAAGLATDPGGYFDIVVAVHTAATTAASHPMGLFVDYVW